MTEQTPENDGLTQWRDAVAGIWFTEDDLEADNVRVPPDNGREGTMRLMTCNVRNTPDMPRKRVVKAARQVRDKAGIIGFQEIVEAEDIADIARGLGNEFRLIGGRPNPIAYRVANFRPSEVRRELAHGRLPGVKGPVYNTIAVFESLKRPQIGQWAVLNTHMIPGAFNGRRDFKDARRQELWKDHWRDIQIEVAKFHRRGIPTFVMGDFNRGSVQPLPRLHRDQRMLVRFGIDRIIYVPGRGFDMMTRSVTKIPTTSDHDAIVAKVTLKRNRG